MVHEGLVLFCLLLIASGCATTPLEKRMQVIQKGMSEKEVIELLGGPAKRSEKYGVEILKFTPPFKKIDEKTKWYETTNWYAYFLDGVLIHFQKEGFSQGYWEGGLGDYVKKVRQDQYLGGIYEPYGSYNRTSNGNQQMWAALSNLLTLGVSAYQNYQTQKSNQKAWNNYNQAVATANRQYAVQQAQAQGAYSQALAAYNEASRARLNAYNTAQTQTQTAYAQANDVSRAQSQAAYDQAVAAYNARLNAYNAAQAQNQAAYQALAASNARANAYYATQPAYQQRTYLTQAEAEAVVRQQWRSNLAAYGPGAMADMDYNTSSEFRQRVDELTGKR